MDEPVLLRCSWLNDVWQDILFREWNNFTLNHMSFLLFLIETVLVLNAGLILCMIKPVRLLYICITYCIILPILSLYRITYVVMFCELNRACVMDDNHYVKLPCIPCITVSPSILGNSHPAAFYLICQGWWHHKFGSTLYQVTPCCLMAPNHCLTQCSVLKLRSLHWLQNILKGHTFKMVDIAGDTILIPCKNFKSL